MKNNSKKFVLILLVLAFIAIGSIAYARGGKKTVDIYYRNIKILVDGKAVAFNKDAAGNQVEPFIYEGTTYLPVRAVGEALGLDVNWDGDTSTVYLGETPKSSAKYLTETLAPYNTSNISIFKLDNSRKLNVTGVEYRTGYQFGYKSSMIFNLNGQYSEIKGIIGHSGTSTTKGEKKLDIYFDGTLYDTIVIDLLELGKEITIPVSGVNQLRLESSPSHDLLGFGDVTIK